MKDKYTLEEAIEERTRLLSLQSIGQLTESDANLLNLLDQWLSHVTSRHTEA